MGSYVVRGCSLWLVVVVLSPGEEWGDTGTGPGWSDFNAGAVEGKPQLIWSSQSVSQSVSQWRLSREMRDRGDQLAVISRSEREIWTRVTVWPGYHPPSPSLTITEQPERRNWFDLSFNLGDHDHAISSWLQENQEISRWDTNVFISKTVQWSDVTSVTWCDVMWYVSPFLVLAESPTKPQSKDWARGLPGRSEEINKGSTRYLLLFPTVWLLCLDHHDLLNTCWPLLYIWPFLNNFRQLPFCRLIMI